MQTAVDPARHSLYLALCAASLVPIAVVFALVAGLAEEVPGLPFPDGLAEALGVIALSLGLLAAGSSIICMPVALAALGSYRRQTPPSRRRTAWTALVLIFLSPLLYGLAALVWSLLFERV